MRGDHSSWRKKRLGGEGGRLQDQRKSPKPEHQGLWFPPLKSVHWGEFRSLRVGGECSQLTF